MCILYAFLGTGLNRYSHLSAILMDARIFLLKLPAEETLLGPKKGIVFDCFNRQHFNVDAADSSWEWLLEWVVWNVLPGKIECEVLEIGQVLCVFELPGGIAILDLRVLGHISIN
jgi:hypothetical protein